jgi:hypothetical protein
MRSTAQMPAPRSEIGGPTEVGRRVGLTGHVHDAAHALPDQIIRRAWPNRALHLRAGCRLRRPDRP